METLKKILHEFSQWALSAGIRLVICLLVLAIGLKLIHWISRQIKRGKMFSRLEAGVRTFLASGLKITLDILLIVTIAGILGIPTTSFVTILASCGVAIGLALQGSLSNLAGGLMLLIFHPFRVGDFIENGTESGTVKDISVFYTTLITPDQKKITLPNGNLTNSTIINYSAMPTRRVELLISVDYEADIDEMKSILLEKAKAHSLVHSDPAPIARLKENADSAMIYSLLVWCNNEDYWAVYYSLQEQIKKELDQRGISIPFPQLQIHTKE